MKIGIIGAMRCEVDSLKGMLENIKLEDVSGIEYAIGTLLGHEVIVAMCGVGKVFAALCAQTMILKYNPDIIINTGVAGGLSKTLAIGDIAVSTAVVQHDMDTSPIGDPKGLISGINIIEIPADKGLCDLVLKSAKELSMRAEAGIIASGDQFVATNERKEYIVDTFGAISCEMEGAAIGQVCYVNNKPFVVIRAISDGGDDEAGMSFDKFMLLAAENSVKLLIKVLEKIFSQQTVFS